MDKTMGNGAVMESAIASQQDHCAYKTTDQDNFVIQSAMVGEFTWPSFAELREYEHFEPIQPSRHVCFMQSAYELMISSALRAKE